MNFQRKWCTMWILVKAKQFCRKLRNFRQFLICFNLQRIRFTAQSEYMPIFLQSKFSYELHNLTFYSIQLYIFNKPKIFCMHAPLEKISHHYFLTIFNFISNNYQSQVSDLLKVSSYGWMRNWPFIVFASGNCIQLN